MLCPGTVVSMKTIGDVILDRPLSKVLCFLFAHMNAMASLIMRSDTGWGEESLHEGTGAAFGRISVRYEYAV
jgi:hypothetical protein